eukprot:754140-Hanusia_phi.AAC.1
MRLFYLVAETVPVKLHDCRRAGRGNQWDDQSPASLGSDWATGPAAYRTAGSPGSGSPEPQHARRGRVTKSVTPPAPRARAAAGRPGESPSDQ